MDNLIDELRAALAKRYAVDRELGRGGMSIVYLAGDLQHGRKVALKVLRPEVTAGLGSERFLREIQIAARLQHPHILPLYDSGAVDGRLYYVMPYVEGESLRQRLDREKQLPIPEALWIARDVGRALAYAHTQGIVHRDIKPENILLSSGIAMVADFGVARAVLEAGGERLTGSGVTVGTPGYMSPEQAGGEQTVDGRSDIYALGCVLFEMLAGEPPFTGPTPQAVLARHMQERPPALHIVRPTVPAELEQLIERALAKAPADRFTTATELVDGLRAAESGAAGPVRPRPWRPRHLIAAAGVAAAAVGLWLALRPSAPPLDANKIVVFPLIERGLPATDSGAGYDVALMIGAALEHTNPLKWIDGWQRLDERQRTNPVLVTPALARRIARERGARYFIEGALRRDADSVALILRLNDAAGDSLIAQGSATAAVGAAPPHQLGLVAVRKLLPPLLDPGRQIDLTALSERRPGAVALWIQGERQYRRARFDAALDLYRRAVEQDSSLAFAAIKGAQAASWSNRLDEAERLAAAARAHESLLPPRYVWFARGFQAYLTGQADTAVMWLERVLTVAPDWGEAAMALGEVYYHLLPKRAPLDSLAEMAFATAARADSGFTPPLVHLADIALRRGEIALARRYLDRLRRESPDSAVERPLELALECVRGGAVHMDWRSAAQRDLAAAYSAAKELSGGAAQAACSEAGFRAVLGTPSAGPAYYAWGALLGLQGLLVTQGHYDEAVRLIDSTVAAGTSQALMLYIVDLWAGAPTNAKAAEVDAFVRRTFRGDYRALSPQSQWLLGIWHAYRGDATRLRTLLVVLAAQARTPGARRAGLLADALAAHLALVTGDTTGAIRRLQALAPTARRDSLSRELSEALPVERLLLARLLLARGQRAEALSVAAAFDQPEPVVYLPFVAASLAVRVRAAEALGLTAVAARARTRLLALGRSDLLKATSSPIEGRHR